MAFFLQAAGMRVSSRQPWMRERLDIILVLLNVHFPLKNKKLLSQVIYMQRILLAGKEEQELPTRGKKPVSVPFRALLYTL